MIKVTDTARDKFLEFIAAEEEPGHVVRVGIAGRGSDGFMYDIMLVKQDDKADDDEVVEVGKVTIFIDADSAVSLNGASLDFVEDNYESGFKVDNPNPLWSDPRGDKIQSVIEEEINPGVASHGGHVMLLDVKEDIAYVKLGGGCQGCGMASVTLKSGIETAIQRAEPTIKQVLDTTDHASGDNPYYQPAKGGEEGDSPFAG